MAERTDKPNQSADDTEQSAEAPAPIFAAPSTAHSAGCERCGEPCGGERMCGTCLAIEAEAKARANP